MIETKFYIYFHINPLKNEVFYVGRGYGSRSHRKTNRNKYWHNTVNKYGYIIDIIESGLTSDEANEREIFYIKKIGRKNLVNMTDGGEGSVGRDPWNKGIKTGDICNNKGRRRSEATKELQRQIKLGNKLTPEHIEKLRLKAIGNKSNTGLKDSDETKLRKSISATKAWKKRNNI